MNISKKLLSSLLCITFIPSSIVNSMESTDNDLNYKNNNENKMMEDDKTTKAKNDEMMMMEEGEIIDDNSNINEKVNNNNNDIGISKCTTSDPNDNIMGIREDLNNDESRYKHDHIKSHKKISFKSKNYYKKDSYNYGKQYYEDSKNKFLGNKRNLDKKNEIFCDSNTNNEEKTKIVRVIKYYNGELSFDNEFPNPFAISLDVLIQDWQKGNVNPSGRMNEKLANQLTRKDNYKGEDYKLVHFDVPNVGKGPKQVIRLYYDSSNILDFATDCNLRKFDVENIIEDEKYQRLLGILPNDKKYMKKDYIPVTIYYDGVLQKKFYYKPKFKKSEKSEESEESKPKKSKPEAQGPSTDDLCFFLGRCKRPKNSKYLDENTDSKIGETLKKIADKAEKDGKIFEIGKGNCDSKYIDIYYKNQNESKEKTSITNNVIPLNSEKQNLNVPQIKKVPSEEKKQGFVNEKEYQKYIKNKDKNNNAKIIKIFQNEDLKCTLYYIDPDEKHVFTKDFIESLLEVKSDEQVNDKNNKKLENDYEGFKNRLLQEAKKLKHEDYKFKFRVNLDETEGDKLINITYIPVNRKIKYEISEEHQYKYNENNVGTDNINKIEFDKKLKKRPENINKDKIKDLIFELCSKGNIENNNLQDYEKVLVENFKSSKGWLGLKNITKDKIECEITNGNRSEPIKIEIKIKLPEISFKRNNPVYCDGWSSNGKEIYAKLNKKEFKEDISDVLSKNEKLREASEYLDNLNDDMSEDSDFQLECHCSPGNICKCSSECADKSKCNCKDDRYYEDFVKISDAVKNGTFAVKNGTLRYCRARLNGAAFLSRDRQEVFDNKDEGKFRHFVFYDFSNFFKVADETYTNSGEKLKGLASLLKKAIEFETPFGVCKIMPKHAETTTKGEDCFLESVLQSEVSSNLSYKKIDENFNKITSNYKNKKEIVKIMRKFFKLKCKADQIETNMPNYKERKKELKKLHWTPAKIWEELLKESGTGTGYYFRYKKSEDPKDSYNELVERVKKLSLEKTQQQLVANICGVLMVSESIRLMDRGKTMTAMLNNLIRQNFK